MEKELKELNSKLDLIFLAILKMPPFIVAPHRRHSNANLRIASANYKEILKQYKEISKHENNDNTPGVEDQVPR